MSEPRPAATAPATAPAGRSVLRPAVWVLHLAIPLLGLWLLLAQPQLDVIWEDHASHLWLVLLVAAVNVVLGLWMGAAARARSDARLFLVSLTFLSSAGFFLLHALATPDILLAEPNTGDTTNLASRLEGQAPVGSVLIGERTRELLGDAAEVEPVGEFQVKGKERPVRAFLLRSILDGSPA